MRDTACSFTSILNENQDMVGLLKDTVKGKKIPEI